MDNTMVHDAGEGQEPAIATMAALPDHTLAAIIELCGKKERQVALVCRRWRALYWQCALWSTFEGGWDYQTWLRSTPTALPAPNRELNTRLLRVLRRIGGGLGSFRLAAAALIAFDDGQTLTELLRCLRRERATAVRLSSEARHDPGDDGLGFTLPHFDPLPACAVRTVSHLRGLTSLSLDSWHLPHCTVDVLARLPRLQELRLRARQLPPGCLAAVLQLADLRSLELSTTMQLGSVSQLSCLTRLTHLALHQHNQAGMPLEPPPVASLPHLQSYSFSNERGPLQLPGGCLRSADFSSTGYHGGGAQLRLSSSWLTPRLTSLSALLDGLLPAGTQLRLLKIGHLLFAPGQAVAAVRRCSQLAGLRCLEVCTLGCEAGEEARVLQGLLAQATGLRQLALLEFFSLPGADAEAACLANYTGLEALNLSCNHGLTVVPRGPYLETVRSLHVGATAIVRLPPVPISAGMPLESLVLAGCTNLHLSSFDVTLLTAMPKLASLDIRGVQMWGGDLVALARERPSLRIRADTEDDHWDPEIAGWQQ